MEDTPTPTPTPSPQPTPTPVEMLPCVKKVCPLKCPITPYQLFTPVSTVFMNNMTYEEQLLGLFKRFNEFVNVFNCLVEDVTNLHESLEELQNLFIEFQKYVAQEIINIYDKIETGLEDVLEKAKKYTDDAVAPLAPNILYDPTLGTDNNLQQILINLYNLWLNDALTAGEYDSLQLTAEAYDNKQLTALQYDFYGRKYLLSSFNINDYQ